MIHTIKSGKLTAQINDFGAELVSAVGADGYEYIWDGKEYWKHHAPVLFPTCGRIVNDTYTYGGKTYHMGIHGFAPSSQFEVTEKTESKIVMSIKATEKTLENYPFNFVFTAAFEACDNVLTTSFTVENRDEKIMPYMVGWHPGFTLDHANGAGVEDYSLKFNTTKNLVNYPVLPTCFVSHDGIDYPVTDGTYVLNESEIYPNDSMLFSGTGERCILSAKGEEHSLDFSWSDNMPFFCIWKAPKSEAMFVCLEPWTNIPGDGSEENFDTKELTRLAPGKSETYTYVAKFL